MKSIDYYTNLSNSSAISLTKSQIYKIRVASWKRGLLAGLLITNLAWVLVLMLTE